MSIKFTVEGLDDARRMFDPRIYEQALNRSLNEVARKARTASIDAITRKFNVKRSDLTQTSTGHSRIKIYSASRGGSRVVIEYYGRPISLSYFGARQVTKTASGYKVVDRKSGRIMKRTKAPAGVTAEIIKGKKTLLPTSFLAAVRAGKSGGMHIGVFNRQTKSRFPIGEKKLITVASMVEQQGPMDAINKTVQKDFEAIFLRNVKWYASTR